MVLARSITVCMKGIDLESIRPALTRIPYSGYWLLLVFGIPVLLVFGIPVLLELHTYDIRPGLLSKKKQAIQLTIPFAPRLT